MRGRWPVITAARLFFACLQCGTIRIFPAYLHLYHPYCPIFSPKSIEMANAHQMGILACMAYVIGCIIGSGIFITPKYVVDYTRDVTTSLAVWAVAGLISMLGGVAYIELATAIPSDGGDYAYQSFVGWKALAFCFMLISCFFTYPGSTSVQAVTFGDYLIQGIDPYVHIDESIKKYLEHGIAVALLVACSLLNFLSIEKFAAKFQVAATAAKFIILGIIVAVGGYTLFFTNNDAIRQPVEEKPFSVGNYVMALYNGLWAFAGWDVLNYGIPSVSNPRRTLPIALIGSLVVVTLTYVLVNLSFFVVLGPQQLLNSEAIAADFAQASLGPLAPFVPFATAIMLLGTVNAEIFVSSRIIYEAARQGHLPPFLSAVHNGTNSYRAALLLQMVVSVLMTFIDVEILLVYVSFVMWAQKLVTMVAFFYIKKTKMPVDDNVLKIPIAISLTFLVALLFLIFIPVVTEFMVTIIGVAIVASGLVLYFAFIYPTRLPSIFYSISDGLTAATSCLLGSEIQKVAPEEEQKPQVPELEIAANGDHSKASDTLLNSR